jgi:hypothetical protein
MNDAWRQGMRLAIFFAYVGLSSLETEAARWGTALTALWLLRETASPEF